MIGFRHLVLSVSLANLCLISVWNRLLYPSARFSMDYSPATSEYAAALLNFGIMSCIFFLLALIYRRYSENILVTKAALLGIVSVVVLVPVNWLRLQVALRFQHFSLNDIFNHFGKVVGIIVIVLVMITLAIVVLHWYGRIMRFMVALVLITSPFCLLTIGQSLVKLLNGEASAKFADRPSLPLIETVSKDKTRVIIVVFDEMDKALAFDKRTPDLIMPEFDRLRGEGFYAENAFPPAMNTIQSMPAFTTGKLLRNVWPYNERELLLNYEGTSTLVPWSSQKNIFTVAHDLGFNTALVGRAIPYSRIIGGSLTKYLLPDSGQEPPYSIDLIKAMRLQFMAVIGTLPFSTRLDLQGKLTSKIEKEVALKQAVALHESNLANSLKLAADRDYSLLLIHYDVPHQPWIYNRFKNDYSWSGDGSYSDNLMLADRTLGVLRREMETAGVWNDTHVIVTSDHWLRSSGKDKRIPFLLKLAGQKGAAHYDKQINTILCFNLVKALLMQKITSYSTLVTWFDSHRTMIGPSPY